MTGSTTLTRASREWFSRPNDERYLTLTSLYEAVRARSDMSRSRNTYGASLIARGEEDAHGVLHLEHEELGILEPTHWSLAQLATLAHAPAAWLREIATVPTGPAFAAHAVNMGLRNFARTQEI